MTRRSILRSLLSLPAVPLALPAASPRIINPSCGWPTPRYLCLFSRQTGKMEMIPYKPEGKHDIRILRS